MLSSGLCWSGVMYTFPNKTNMCSMRPIKTSLCFPAGMNPQGTEAVTIGQLCLTSTAAVDLQSRTRCLSGCLLPGQLGR